MNFNPFLQVLQTSKQFLHQYTPESPLSIQLEGHLLIQKLKLLNTKYLKLPSQLPTIIAERTCFQSEGLRVSLYSMPKGTIMGIHNHPNMVVISYIVSGKLKIQSYSPLQIPTTFRKQKNVLGSGQFSIIDGMRQEKDNLHDLEALEDTLFLDIIFPDYDEERDCICFEEEQKLETNVWRLKEVPCNVELDSF